MQSLNLVHHTASNQLSVFLSVCLSFSVQYLSLSRAGCVFSADIDPARGNQYYAVD